MCPSQQDARNWEVDRDQTGQDGIVESTRDYHPGGDEDEDDLVSEARWIDDGSRTQTRNKAGARDLVLRRPRHRVRRTCHVCSTEFAHLSKHCDKCQHVRCTDCPRDPPKLSKYPFGYPGDVFGPNSIPYYECAKCWTLYARDAEEGTPCRRCGEQKSNRSPRAKPRAIDPDFDSTFLRQLEAKLDELEAHGVDVFLHSIKA